MSEQKLVARSRLGSEIERCRARLHRASSQGGTRGDTHTGTGRKRSRRRGRRPRWDCSRLKGRGRRSMSSRPTRARWARRGSQYRYSTCPVRAFGEPTTVFTMEAERIGRGESSERGRRAAESDEGQLEPGCLQRTCSSHPNRDMVGSRREGRRREAAARPLSKHPDRRGLGHPPTPLPRGLLGWLLGAPTTTMMSTSSQEGPA